MINYEITYPSNPHFVFHDSRGIEVGAESIEAREGVGPNELETSYIQKFIDDRAQEKRLRDQLHAIWYVFGNSYDLDIKLLKVLHANGQSESA